MFWIPKGKKRRHLHDTQLSLLCSAKRRTLLYKSGIKNEKREKEEEEEEEEEQEQEQEEAG